MMWKHFTLGVVVLLGVLAWGQEDQQGTGTAGGWVPTHPLCTGCFEVPEGPKTISSSAPDSIPSVDVPPITRAYNGAKDFSQALLFGAAVLVNYMTDPLQRMLYLPAGQHALSPQAMQFMNTAGLDLLMLGGLGGSSRGGSIFNNKVFYIGSFHDNLSLWEMQDFGSQWGVNANIPGRHLLGKLDVLSTNPEYADAVERVSARFWQKDLAIQNAINREPQLVKVFKQLAKGDPELGIEADPSFEITHPKDFPGNTKTIFEHYQKRGLKAFDNP